METSKFIFLTSIDSLSLQFLIVYANTLIESSKNISDAIKTLTDLRTDSSTDVYINSLLNEANDITKRAEILKYNIKTLSDSIGK